MNIVILNGNPDPKQKDPDRYINALGADLSAKGHSFQSFQLRDMEIRQCSGCWSCWIKTPGLCAQRDDMPLIYKAVMAADLVIFSSPVIMGFMSALLKRANERFIPLIHPYIALVEGECHHRGRYDRYPGIGILLHRGPDTDDEDIAIITDTYRRVAINFRTALRCAFTTDRPISEVSHAIADL
ncbi:MAG TPA: NAD(P)H-dependent oxidoreductase [Spirochaetota bacterium]|nr:NAD(P)H-dependent oxidoreductase [Spirochaetota bacterium]HPC41917.1 NAD(P)H-dependent oxidoreductase [Spirochaetota bacterium]HPL17355.1 NAD(P)H-dependent oxidoreductase [Spirochaetota bacterium]HQF09627.1 NAD(P)H-dependent oxidoreductase [Spirochaetota bacterium]HQH98303.1 NAD(P)H-dependent oxidoreductase [Spirochaetota bacterium]